MNQRIDNLIEAMDALSSALWQRGLIGDLTYAHIQDKVTGARELTASASPAGPDHSA